MNHSHTSCRYFLPLAGINHHKSPKKNTVERCVAEICGQYPDTLPPPYIACGQHEAKEIAAFYVLEAGSVCWGPLRRKETKTDGY